MAQDSSAEPAQEAAPERPSAEVEACKKPYREAIDAIDLEIKNSYSPEQREYYLGRLKTLIALGRDHAHVSTEAGSFYGAVLVLSCWIAAGYFLGFREFKKSIS